MFGIANVQHNYNVNKFTQTFYEKKSLDVVKHREI
jgi:hypothetical protein